MVSLFIRCFSKDKIAVLRDKFSFQFSTDNLNAIFSMTYHDNEYTQLVKSIKVSPSSTSQDVPSDVSDHLEPKYKMMSQSLKHLKRTSTHLKISSSPSRFLPNSEFELNCLGGIVGDGNVLYLSEHGEAIQCDECHDGVPLHVNGKKKSE